MRRVPGSRTKPAVAGAAKKDNAHHPSSLGVDGMVGVAGTLSSAIEKPSPVRSANSGQGQPHVVALRGTFRQGTP